MEEEVGLNVHPKPGAVDTKAFEKIMPSDKAMANEKLSSTKKYGYMTIPVVNKDIWAMLKSQKCLKKQRSPFKNTPNPLLKAHVQS